MLEQIITLLYLSGEPVKTDTIATFLSTTKEEVEKHIGDISASLNGIGLALLVSQDGLSIVTKP